jgi:DNA-binding transcriptional regulator YhcF (GntR family)
VLEVFSCLGKNCNICYTKVVTKKEADMIIEIDFNSDEAIYVQLCNQIILGIATSQFREGEQLPSVRQLAETIGINMHTVNKAYSILQREGFVKIDRRRGAIIAIDINRLQALQEAQSELAVVLARAICKGIDRDEIHELVDKLYDNYERIDGI